MITGPLSSSSSPALGSGTGGRIDGARRPGTRISPDTLRARGLDGIPSESIGASSGTGGGAASIFGVESEPTIGTTISPLRGRARSTGPVIGGTPRWRSASTLPVMPRVRATGGETTAVAPVLCISF